MFADSCSNEHDLEKDRMRSSTATEFDTLRQKTLEAAKRHKASWVELGQYLFTVYREKHYRRWDYLDFETYCLKELRIKQMTAVKLLKAYSFLEKEEPEVLEKGTRVEEDSPAVPNFEAVNLLRLAKNNEKLTPRDFQALREAVLEAEKEPKEVRGQMKRILESKDERDAREVKREKRLSTIKRLVTILTHSKEELEKEDLIPGYLLKQMSDLVEKLKDQLV